MEARVNPDYSIGVVRAFAGNEFVRYEWRKIPENVKESEIKNLEDYGLLEFRKPEEYNLESLRLLAKAEGIPHYWNKKAERLQFELDSLDEEE